MTCLCACVNRYVWVVTISFHGPFVKFQIDALGNVPVCLCNLVPGNQIASLQEKQRKVIDSVIKAKIMGLSTPGGQSSGLEHYISV